MSLIPLTQNRFALVDSAYYEWLMTWKWHTAKQGNTYYAFTNTRFGDGTRGKIRMHRLLMVYPVGLEVDHINHNGVDNRKANLRTCTHRENQSNLRKPGSSKYTGVYWCNRDKRWKSAAWIDGGLRYLGSFQEEIDAHTTYQKAIEYTQKEALLT